MDEPSGSTSNAERTGGADRSRLPGRAEGGHPDLRNATELQHHLLVERVRDYAIFLMDPDGVITHWGEGAVRMKEFSPDEAVGMHLRDLYPPEGAEDGTADEHLETAAREGEYVGEGMRQARDRGLFPARVTLTALRRDGRLIGFSKVTQDLTERRRDEARLHAALRAAQAASVEKSRFLATMSHEIRTPINAVLGYAELLDLGVAGAMNDVQAGYIKRIQASGRHLLALVEDVLDFSRVEAGRLTVNAQQGRLAKVAVAAAELVRPQAEAAGLTLDVACDNPEVEYWGDERRVTQILVNLLSNAVKFTPAGGRIQVSCSCTEPDPAAELPAGGPWTCLRVQDTGIGIAPDRLVSIFEPFVQVDDELTRAQEGTGLGLAISRRLARLLGGDLTVRSQPGQGAIFSLWLSTGRPPEPPTGEGAWRAREASLARVGQYLSGSAPQIVRAYTERLRGDPATPRARDAGRAELEDHTATLVTELAQVLVLAQEGGPGASRTARDGDDLQALLAERHGRQRRALGWTETALRRGYQVLWEEVDVVLQGARDVAAGETIREAAAILQPLLDRARDVSLAAFRAGEE